MTSTLQDSDIRCLFFDTFGTCVDWRTTVTDTLWKTARDALSSGTASIDSHVRSLATDMDWRNGYYHFTFEISQDPSIPWKTVDEHHFESFKRLLTTRGLLTDNDNGSLWTEPEIQDLSLVWHRLDPWPDTQQGLAELNKNFQTCILSNGNMSLLNGLVAHGKLPVQHILSAEMFRSYKPSPKVYLGAVEKMGLKPEQCALVAAHLEDLKAAKACGLRTVYVERRDEESHGELRGDGIEDVWVGEGEEGLVRAAEKLGVKVGT
ncbi:hypothetical protein PRZ48_014137 [Zasmidium cellare]|uniref:Haloacid dehalogenase n=1 Tax=Zasmidium cellare TaxID=395010 RepID=A0ABR0E0L3_ZASCE|nr:hypothetical protein PRZ48_014137 [Zasmidium cellare]